MTVRYRPRTPCHEADDYQVGYKKPPIRSQFKKGQSGNPNGRPKKSRNANKLAHDLLNEEMQFTENGEQRTASKREVTLRTQSAKAVQGDHRATDRLLAMDEAHQSKKAKPEGGVQSFEELHAADLEILEAFTGKEVKYVPPED
ncbi:MAG: DUF5681 domain-containing protein [Pseudomonadota bacterium]